MDSMIQEKREDTMDQVSKVTPSTYDDMNAEFERDGTPFRILPTTQQQIDDRIERSKILHPKVVHNHMI